MLQQADLDLVVVCTPPGTHVSFTRAALDAGKHVLVEKPFTPTSAEADDLVRRARERGRLLCVYQNRRWDADFLTLQALLRGGQLGRVYELETHYDRFRPSAPTTWKGRLTMAEGGGAIYDLGVHVLDQVYVLFGMPTFVSAKFVNQREGRVLVGNMPEGEPDSFTAVLTYHEKGLLVFVRVGVLSVETQQVRFWVRGSKGSYHKTGVDPQEDQLKAGMEASDPGFGKEGSAWDGRLCLINEESGAVEEMPWPNVAPAKYLALYEMLGRALETGKEEDLPVPASQAADVLRIVEGIKESAVSGKDVLLSS